MNSDHVILLIVAAISAVAALLAAVVQAIAAIISAWISRKRDP